MEEDLTPVEVVAKRTPDERCRKETDLAYEAIVEQERRAQLEKNMRLRSMRIVKK